jgi:uncharacterized protein YlbG (UPF0298 family)
MFNNFFPKTLQLLYNVEKYSTSRQATDGNIQRVSKRMTRFQIIICNNENVLQLQNKLQTIK